MEKLIKAIEDKLYSYVPNIDALEKKVFDSMKYSLSAGGKRIRPILTAYFCELNGGTLEQALPFGCTLEMIHTYSLIHDDLPCMDNDDMRRGKPSNHIVFGEDTALLAGDALQSLAFEVLSDSKTRDLVGDTACIKAVNCLAKRIGAVGMVGGQVIDLEYENKSADVTILRTMDDKKTGALISAACELGCIAANANDKAIEDAVRYAKALGLAFQVVDDILDVTADEKELGKHTGSDKENNKSTYVSLYGIDKCKKLVSQLTEEAIGCIYGDSESAKKLRELAINLAQRNK